MNLNFKNILTESIVDDLNISKIDKIIDFILYTIINISSLK